MFLAINGGGLLERHSILGSSHSNLYSILIRNTKVEELENYTLVLGDLKY